MFKYLFALFALLAVAFAAPQPNPAVVAALPYSSLGYGGYVAPAAYPAVATYGAVPAYSAYSAYSPVVYG